MGAQTANRSHRMNDRIENAEALEAIFGEWPSFHDAEVWSLTQQRTEKGFDVIATIHVFQMTSEVDSSGYYVLRNHTRVTFRFMDCERAEFRHFNLQNALSDLWIEPAEPESVRPMTVRFGESYGLEGSLHCAAIRVVEAIPWIPDSGVYARNNESQFNPSPMPSRRFEDAGTTAPPNAPGSRPGEAGPGE